MLGNGSLNTNGFAKDEGCPAGSDRNPLYSSKEGDGCSTHHTMALLQRIPRVKKGLRFHTRNIPSLLAHIYPGMATVQWLEASERCLQVQNW